MKKSVSVDNSEITSFQDDLAKLQDVLNNIKNLFDPTADSLLQYTDSPYFSYVFKLLNSVTDSGNTNDWIYFP